MRAGSLSDARVVALLRKYFVCARLPELSTKDLIRDPRDIALLERLHAEAMAGPYPRRPGFFGGEREAFFTPDGEVLDVFLSLGTQGRSDSQFLVEQRARPEAMVQRFFERAASALRAVHGALPDDFEALCDGSAAAVAEVAASVVPHPRVASDGPALRVSVRNDRVMYTELCGQDLIAWKDAELAQLLPDCSVGERARKWPRAAFLRIAHASYPRGAVLPRLRDESILGELHMLVDEVTDAAVRGRIEGRLELRPTTGEEVGARKEARMPFELRMELCGDFTFDRVAGHFTALRIVSRASELTHVYGGRKTRDRYWLGVELARPRAGTAR